MLAHTFWLLGFPLEGVVLLRGLQARLLRCFPLFYTYLCFVLLQDGLRVVFLRWLPNFYGELYWFTQFVSLVLGSVVVFEIYSLSLREFPGTARMARNLLGAAFIVILVKAVLTARPDSAAWINGAYVSLERDLRVTQSIAIVLLLLLFIWYSIPFGRNLGGILLGYSVFVATSVAQLSIVSHYWHKAEAFWAVAQPTSYLLALGIWAYALWKSDATPGNGHHKGTGSGMDYDTLARRTSRQMDEVRSRLGTAVRP